MSEEATIRRGVRNARYTTLPNHVFEDIRLSMEARWLLGYLLSKPDNWTVRMGDIAKKGACGRDKARRMINELVEHGYAEKDQQREDGRFAKLSLVIYDEPKEQSEINGSAPSVAFVPQTENPSTVNPSTEKPATVNAALVKTEDLAIPESQKREAHASEQAGSINVDDPRKFERRVKRLAGLTYPTKRGDKPSTGWPNWGNSSTDWTVSRFARLSDDERAEAEKHAQAYLNHTGSSALSLGTYFVERKWRDLPAEVLAPEAKPSVIDAPVFGPVWGGVLVRELILVTPVEGPPPSAFMAEQLKRTDEIGEQARRTRRAAHGWPKVNFMVDRARQYRRGIAVPAALAERIKPLMEVVMVRSPLYEAWRVLFAARGWPWIPDPGDHPAVFFPVGGPDGLAVFEQAIRDEGMGDDGGTRQAAE